MPISPQVIKNMPEPESKALKKVLEEQRDILLKIYEQTNKTRRYILAGRILSLVYILLAIAPIVVAIIYLPPYIKQLIGPIKQLLHQTDQINNGVDTSTINELINLYK